MGAGGAFTGILRSAAFAAAGANINVATADSNNLRISIPHPGFVTEGICCRASQEFCLKADISNAIPVYCCTQNTDYQLFYALNGNARVKQYHRFYLSTSAYDLVAESPTSVAKFFGDLLRILVK